MADNAIITGVHNTKVGKVPGSTAMSLHAEATPAGAVHNFTVVERAPSEAFKPDAPYVLALVDMEDGYRMMMNVVGCDPGIIEIGMAVRIIFEDRHGQKLPQATPAAQSGHGGERC